MNSIPEPPDYPRSTQVLADRSAENSAAYQRLGPLVRSERFNSPTNFPRDGHGARELRARRDFCRRCPTVPPRNLLRDAPVPARPSDADQGRHVRVRRAPGRGGANPVSLSILHVRPHFRHIRCRGDLPPPMGLRLGRPLELHVARGQVLDFPVPRDHVRRHPVRAQEGGGHPDMSAVVTTSASITGRSVPAWRRVHRPSEPQADPAAGGLQVPSAAERVRSGGRPPIHHAAQTPRGQVMPEFWINMGPQHPMTHGLWNMKVRVDGETVTDAKPEIGYLHRGYEKIMEVREFQKNVVLTDRLCYVSSITWSHAYCLAVEKMMGIETPERGQWIRVVALELQRVASHLMWLAAYGPDLGLLTGLLWALRERELFLDLLQLLTGARMNQNFPRIGGVRNDLPPDFDKYCFKVIKHFREKMSEYERLFQDSKIFLMRTQGVGKISLADAIDWGVTGPNLRACGMDVDLRRLEPYEAYPEVEFEPQVWRGGDGGDSYA